MILLLEEKFIILPFALICFLHKRPLQEKYSFFTLLINIHLTYSCLKGLSVCDRLQDLWLYMVHHIIHGSATEALPALKSRVYDLKDLLFPPSTAEGNKETIAFGIKTTPK